MSEGEEPAAASKPSAGRLLREAREKQGLHIAALAAAIKVAPKKLELLESDRFDQLPDATFTRALAQTVCRALKIDAAPIMQVLPPLTGHRLEHVGEGLNTPFRERPGALVQRDWTQIAASPLAWVVGLMLVATMAIYLLPGSLASLAVSRTRRPAPATPRPAGEPGASSDAAAMQLPLRAQPAAASGVATDAALGTALGAAASTSNGNAGSSPVASAANPPASAGGELSAAMLQLRSSAPSWVEVTDAHGKALVSRLLQPGEAVGVDGTPPLKVRIGNAAGTQLSFRGQPTDLHAYTRDNVARLELK